MIPYDWLNKFYSFCLVALVGSVLDMALEMKCDIVANLMRLS